MSVRKYLSQESIRLDIASSLLTEQEAKTLQQMMDDNQGDGEDYLIDDTDMDTEYEIPDIKKPHINEIRKKITRDMAEILYASGKVQNLNKLTTSLFNVEKRTSSAIGCGIAIPHVRCLQTKTVIMGFARYDGSIEFAAPDEEYVQIFIPMIAPPYDDREYLRLYRNIANAFLKTDLKQELLSVQAPWEVVKVLNHYLC